MHLVLDSSSRLVTFIVLAASAMGTVYVPQSGHPVSSINGNGGRGAGIEMNIRQCL